MTTLPQLLRPASYVYGTWHTAPDGPTVLDAAYGRPLAIVSSEGVDFAQATDYARRVGGPRPAPPDLPCPRPSA